MPIDMLVMLGLLVLSSWFLLGGQRTAGEKASLILAIIFIYITYKYITGATLEEIFDPIVRFLEGK